MSRGDDTLPIRPVLPVCCYLLDIGRAPSEGYHSATCSRCERLVSVNTRVETALLEAGHVRTLVCVSCWSGTDQDIVQSYRYLRK